MKKTITTLIIAAALLVGCGNPEDPPLWGDPGKSESKSTNPRGCEITFTASSHKDDLNHTYPPSLKSAVGEHYLLLSGLDLGKDEEWRVNFFDAYCGTAHTGYAVVLSKPAEGQAVYVAYAPRNFSSGEEDFHDCEEVDNVDDFFNTLYFSYRGRRWKCVWMANPSNTANTASLPSPPAE